MQNRAGQLVHAMMHADSRHTHQLHNLQPPIQQTVCRDAIQYTGSLGHEHTRNAQEKGTRIIWVRAPLNRYLHRPMKSKEPPQTDAARCPPQTTALLAQSEMHPQLPAAGHTVPNKHGRLMHRVPGLLRKAKRADRASCGTCGGSRGERGAKREKHKPSGRLFWGTSF